MSVGVASRRTAGGNSTKLLVVTRKGSILSGTEAMSPRVTQALVGAG